MANGLNIDDLLGRAYHVDQRRGQRVQAIAMIRDAANDPLVATILREKRDHLRAVRWARQFGERDGCHVTATLVDLLDRALP